MTCKKLMNERPEKESDLEKALLLLGVGSWHTEVRCWPHSSVAFCPALSLRIWENPGSCLSSHILPYFMYF